MNENQDKKIKQAIALEYNPEEDAPKVVASGRGLLAEKIIEKHGADKILFASDSPWHNPAWEKHMVESLNLTEEEKEKIYWKNAVKLLNI